MAADVSGLVANLRDRYRDVHATAVALTVDLLVAAAPRGRGPTGGATAESIMALPQVDAGDRFTADVVAPTDQAGYSNDGTIPHEIRPVRANALRWESGGEVHFAKVVHHPGNAGTHWWDIALRDGWSTSLQEAIA